MEAWRFLGTGSLLTSSLGFLPDQQAADRARWHRQGCQLVPGQCADPRAPPRQAVHLPCQSLAG